MKLTACAAACVFPVLFGLVSCGGGGGGTDGLPPSLPVQPLYPTSGANWNDYVKDDGTTRITASDSACDRLFADHYSFCIHGGQYRLVEITGVTSCTGLTASDALDAFNWTCRDGSGVARVVSVGLKDHADLSDLIDWTAVPPQWRANSVTVRNGAATVATTPAEIWWGNPIVADNDGGSLGTAGTIYVVTTNPDARYTIDASRIGFVVKPGVVLTAPATVASESVVAATGPGLEYLWVEGTIDARSNWAGIHWSGVYSSVLRNVDVANGEVHGVALQQGSYGNYLSKVRVSNNFNGLSLSGSALTLVRQVTSTNNSVIGVDTGTRDQTLMDITAANNVTGISYASGSMNSILINATTVNNNDGISAPGSTNLVFENIATVNNLRGLWLSFAADNNFFANFLATHNDTGVILDSSSFNAFSGRLKVGNVVDCVVGGSLTPTDPGLVDITCANQGASDATLAVNVIAAGAFVGKVTTDDSANASDSNGTASYDSLADWTSFENRHRGWGKEGNPFADPTNRMHCVSGETCRTWDWRLANGDTGDGGSPAALDVLGVPIADDTITHTWSFTVEASCNRVPGASWSAGTSRCTSTFLRHAEELIGDGIGNENGLCESNETCLFTPNIGAYQGQGNLVSVGSVTGGVISGVTLLRYATNGI